MWKKCRVCSRFSVFFRNISDNFQKFIGIYGELLFHFCRGCSPSFFLGKKANVANVFLVFLPFPCQDVEKVEVFLQNPFFCKHTSEKFSEKIRVFRCIASVFSGFIFPMFFRTSFLRRVFESEINPKKQKLYKYFQDLALWLRRVFDYPRHRDDDSNWYRVNRPMDPAFSDLPLRQPTRLNRKTHAMKMPNSIEWSRSTLG